MPSNITPHSVRQQLRQVRGDIAALDGLLVEADSLPPMHLARLALKLDDAGRDLALLIDQTQRLLLPMRKRTGE